MNTDQLIEQMERDELEDKLELQGKASPREYAQMRGMVPQRVYYFIRSKKIEMEHCICGRKVIDIKKADEFFDNRESGSTPLEPEVPEEEEVPGGDVDTGELSS
jgi:hypothetical protein